MMHVFIWAWDYVIHFPHSEPVHLVSQLNPTYGQGLLTLLAMAGRVGWKHVRVVPLFRWGRGA